MIVSFGIAFDAERARGPAPNRGLVGRAKIAALHAVAAAMLAASGLAAAACSHPPSSDWHFVDDLAVNIRLTATGPVGTGTYKTVDREANYSSITLRDATLSWSGYSSTKYSANLRDLAGWSDSRRRESIRVTLDVPPMYEARMRVRELSQYKFYSFDAACLWFDPGSNRYVTQIADHGLRGDALHTWHESSITYRTVY